MQIELANCTWTLLNEISNGATRDSVALTYALAMVSSEKADWKQVNAAIIARWSVSALTYIKTRAWKLVEEKRREVANGA